LKLGGKRKHNNMNPKRPILADKMYVVRVSSVMYEEYRLFCEENSINMSKRLKKYMENDLKMWREIKSRK